MANTAKIRIPYRPRQWAKPLHQSVLGRAVRWYVLVIHRRGGKTTAAFNQLQRDALENPGTRYAYIAPTYKQAKRIVWAMAKHYSQDIPGVKYNVAELLITYANGSEIMIVGANEPDSLRGIALWGCFLDEYPQMSPIVFTEIITKCLADHLGYCIFGGTPKGKGHFFKIYQVAIKNPGEWLAVYKTIDESLKEEEGPTIDALRQALEDDRKLVTQGLMTEDEFQQEWYNSFEAAIKGAVYLKELAGMRKENRVGGGLYDKTLPVYTVWDLGISDAMCIGFYQKVGREVRKVHYYENTGLGLAHYITVLQTLAKERGFVYAKHFAPHDINQRELSTGKTRLETARKLGIEFEVVPSIPLEDGIDLCRSFLTRLYVDKLYCDLFLDLIGQYHYEFDEKRNRFKPKPVHDFTSHAADETRYAAIVEDEFYNDGDIPPPPTPPSIEDEYMGDEGYEDGQPDGMGKHPALKGVDIGKMGHTKPPPRALMVSPYYPCYSALQAGRAIALKCAGPPS